MAIPWPLHRKDTYDFYIDFIQQVFVKSVHLKIRNHHSTPTNPTMGEQDIIRALCPKSTNNPPPAKATEYY
jgi:hypothetical protein